MTPQERREMIVEIQKRLDGYPRLMAALKLAYPCVNDKYVKEELLLLLNELEPPK